MAQRTEGVAARQLENCSLSDGDVLLGIATGDESQRLLQCLFSSAVLMQLIDGRSLSNCSLEQSGKGTDAVESDSKADFSHRVILCQQQLRPFNPFVREVLMRSLSVDFLEEPQEVELGEVCLSGDAIDIDVRAKILVDEQLALDYSPVQINLRI